MVSILVELSKKNIIIAFFVKIICWIIFNIVNIYNELCGLLRQCGIGGNQYKSLKKYHNIHSGDRCFIIATGPSLTLEDLELLKNEKTFGMNSITKIYDKTNFRPTYYGIQDHLVYSKMENEILKHYKNADNVFVSDRIKWHSKVGDKWNVFPLNMSYHAYKRWFNNKFFVKFSDNIYRRVYSGFSITYSLIEIAVYMGFKEIYLIGADCSFTKSRKIHFVEHGVVDKSLETASDRNIAGYEAALEYTKHHDVKIYNSTRGGELEVFKRINLDDIAR
ncbi:6-hydroxymethylpterin diphosphokinase MptE-like protein [Clostridium butyricum]|uniref:6-hydroxymethylpterin diphosphokinase MptE-like protein n=1 Tax=Clostridium butyricum TaxID=1492 RepID=UPI003D33D9C9